ncbi:LysR family transcriptional regulator [Lentibacter sp.]|uniref:LysR family transcriptional regulator n=1 Tax=Lentibacter sp. TaxID=2024994 RepID=UPI003F6AD3C2
MDRLNYHHLRYFREVAKEGHLGRVAARLNVSQSALSIQIKQLEDRLGHPLFDRVGRGLVLTEAGKIALAHAERIFGAGQELLAELEQSETANPPLRVGALSTLSRNFQLQFLRPLLAAGRFEIDLKSGNMRGLLADLEALELDVVLTTEVPQGAGPVAFAAQRIAEQPVALHGQPARLAYAGLAQLLAAEPVILPTESNISAGFESLCARLGVQPRIAARVDDMAMVRLLTREGAGVALAPSVVLADEIAAGTVASAPYDLGIKEVFYAVSAPRRFAHPALRAVLGEQFTRSD